jgi:hypothetical protein
VLYAFKQLNTIKASLAGEKVQAKQKCMTSRQYIEYLIASLALHLHQTGGSSRSGKRL